MTVGIPDRGDRRRFNFVDMPPSVAQRSLSHGPDSVVNPFNREEHSFASRTKVFNHPGHRGQNHEPSARIERRLTRKGDRYHQNAVR